MMSYSIIVCNRGSTVGDTGNTGNTGIIMARRAIPMIAFPRVRCMFIYIYIYIYIFNRPLTRVCVVYVVKEVTSFRGARSINGRGA